MTHIKWLDKPEAHDYDAALDFLGLHLGDEQAQQGVDGLREVEVGKKKAKDILRAANLKPLPSTDKYVARDLKKIHDGEALSPVLLFRAYPTIVADGYHRISAAYDIDPDTEVHCQIL